MNLYVSDMKTSHWRWHGSPRLTKSWFGLLKATHDLEALLAIHPHLRGHLSTVTDWTTSLVVVAALGETPTGGYAVKIHEIVRTGDLVRVTVHMRNPAPTDFVIQALTYPIDSVCLRRDLVSADLSWIFLDQTGRRLVSDAE